MDAAEKQRHTSSMQVPGVVLCEEKAYCFHGHLTAFGINIGSVFTRFSVLKCETLYMEIFRAADSQGRDAAPGNKGKMEIGLWTHIREMVSRGGKGRGRSEAGGLNVGLTVLFRVAWCGPLNRNRIYQILAKVWAIILLEPFQNHK